MHLFLLDLFAKYILLKICSQPHDILYSENKKNRRKNLFNRRNNSNSQKGELFSETEKVIRGRMRSKSYLMATRKRFDSEDTKQIIKNCRRKCI